jgi:hypothetical protein
MFFKALEDQARIVNRIITSFKKGTGQMVNPAKCSMVGQVLHGVQFQVLGSGNEECA